MKIRSFQVLLFLIVIQALTGSVRAQKPSLSAGESYQKGVQLKSSAPQQAFGYFLQAVGVSDPASDLFLKALHELALLGTLLEGEYGHKAFDQSRRAIPQLSSGRPNNLLIADLYYMDGYWYDKDLQPDSALICFEYALRIRKNQLGEKMEVVAECYHGMGDVYKYQLYDFEAAEKSYERALEIREKLVPKSEYQLARTYFNLATTNRSQRDFEKAISYAYRTLELVRKMSHEEFLNSTYSILANIYRDMNQFDSARHLYELAITSNKKNHPNQKNEKLAGFYQGMGNVLKLEGKYDDAIISYNQGLEIFRAIQVTQKKLFLHSLQQLGEIYFFKKQPDRAMVLYRESLKLHKASRILKSGSGSDLYRGIGDVFQQNGQFDSSLYYYQQSLISAVRDFDSSNIYDNPDLATIELRNFVYPTLVEKADVLMKMYRQSKKPSLANTALKCYSLAEQVLNAARNSLDMEEAKWAFLDTNFDLYEKSIATAFELYQTTGADSLVSVAFHYFESGKSRSLSDAMQTAEYANPAVLTDSVLRERNSYKMGLLSLQDRLKNTTDEKKILVLRNSLVDLDRKMKLNEIQIRTKYPRYLEVKYEYQVPSLQEIQKFADHEGSIVLEYFWGNQQGYAIGITGSQVLFRQLGRVDSLKLPIEHLLTCFKSDRSGLDMNSFRLFTHASFELDERLVKPFEVTVGRKGRMIIIPDGPIGLVPFEVLISTAASGTSVNYWKLDYLIKRYITDYAFSAAMLLHQKRKPVESPKLLAFGLTGSLDPGTHVSSAGGAALELASLAKQFPTGRFYLGDQATKKDFRSEAPSYDLIHLAVHGRGDTEKNYASSLYFRDQGQDGELHWYELYDMRLKASLAVLSACESGIGKTYKGEGMLSMAHAFAYSGCDNMVMALWKVNDQVSIQLMEKFYEGILEGKRIDEALADSKRRYLAASDELSANPKIWGALVAYGDQQVVEKKKSPWIFISLGTLLLLLTIAVTAFIRKHYLGGFTSPLVTEAK